MNALRWPNAERAVVAWLKPRLVATVFSETSKTMPPLYAVVERTGGGDGILIDKKIDVAIAVVAPTRGAMWDLAADVESAMWALSANATADGVYVDEVECPFGFAWDPPASQEIRRATATFTLTVRPSA